MSELDLDTLLFFDGHADALPMYEKLETTLFQAFPETRKKVQKTQITFYNRHFYACASLLRAKRKADLPDPYLTISLGLPYPLESERVASKVETYPGRWTTHIVIGSPDEIDDELLLWVEQAYGFADSKR